jgi:hypothetical protein
MRSSLLVTVSALALIGCGGGGLDWTEDEKLIPDSEIDSQQSQLVSAEPAQPAAGAVQGAYVKVVWGYLAGRLLGAPGWIDWTGSLSVDGGSAALQSLVFFDRGDSPLPTSGANEIDWRSRTWPHYDGLIALVQPAAAGDLVHLQTPPLTKDLPVADLAQGQNLHYVVDADGHEVSITSIPAGACGGFAYGYERIARKGWKGFGGLLTEPAGKVIGRLRFRAEGGTLFARVVDADRNVLAEGEGSLSASAEGGSFEIGLQKPDGTGFGAVTGIFQSPTYAVRGAFQATWKCP